MHQNRGMFLESVINKTLRFFDKNELALFHKNYAPVQLGKVEKNNDKISWVQGFIKGKGTTDYYGVYKGIFVTFEAKSTQKNFLPLNNISSHQQLYLQQVSKMGGIAFYVVGFVEPLEFYVLTPRDVAKTKGRSVSIAFCRKKCFKIKFEYPGILNFLNYLDAVI